MSANALIFALPIPSDLRPSPLDKGRWPPVPHYGGRTPERLCGISGAQNQEGLGAFPSRPTGALSVQNLILLRFSDCA